MNSVSVSNQSPQNHPSARVPSEPSFKEMSTVKKIADVAMRVFFILFCTAIIVGIPLAVQLTGELIDDLRSTRKASEVAIDQLVGVTKSESGQTMKVDINAFFTDKFGVQVFEEERFTEVVKRAKREKKRLLIPIALKLDDGTEKKVVIIVDPRIRRIKINWPKGAPSHIGMYKIGAENSSYSYFGLLARIRKQTNYREEKREV